MRKGIYVKLRGDIIYNLIYKMERKTYWTWHVKIVEIVEKWETTEEMEEIEQEDEENLDNNQTE